MKRGCQEWREIEERLSERKEIEERLSEWREIEERLLEMAYGGRLGLDVCAGGGRVVERAAERAAGADKLGQRSVAFAQQVRPDPLLVDRAARNAEQRLRAQVERALARGGLQRTAAHGKKIEKLKMEKLKNKKIED